MRCIVCNIDIDRELQELFFGTIRSSNKFYCTPHCKFLTLFSINKKTKCWEWNLVYKNGYGRFNYEGRQIYAHHASIELFSDEFYTKEPYDQVLHECDNKICVSFYHLKLSNCIQNKLDEKRMSCLIKEEHPVFPICSKGENVLRSMGGYVLPTIYFKDQGSFFHDYRIK